MARVRDLVRYAATPDAALQAAFASHPPLFTPAASRNAALTLRNFRRNRYLRDGRRGLIYTQAESIGGSITGWRHPESGSVQSRMSSCPLLQRVRDRA
jgi:hypothetical protein